MASNINPDNIDENYPIANQNNPTQTFRDNFSAIVNNFARAKEEIIDLQTNAILKSALAGSSLSNDMNGTEVVNLRATRFRETFNNLGPVGGVTPVTIAFNVAHVFSLTTSGNVTLDIEWGAAITGLVTLDRMRLIVDVTDPAHTLTFPAEVQIGTNRLNATNQTVTFPETGVYVFELYTVNNGATVLIEEPSGKLSSSSFETDLTSVQNSITDLKNKAITKSALSGGPSLNNTFTAVSTPLVGAELKKTTESLKTHVTTSGPVTVSFDDAQVHAITPTGNITLSASWPGITSGRFASMKMIVTVNNPAYTITCSGGFVNDALPYMATNIITFPKVGQYFLEITTIDGGTSIGLRDLNPQTFQVDPVNFAGANSISAVHILTNKLVTTSSASALTLPTGSDIETNTYLGDNQALDWSLINTSAGASSISAAAGHTVVGSTTVAANSSAMFRTRKTATNTAVTYRIN
jgi:hypothetical protein